MLEINSVYQTRQLKLGYQSVADWYYSDSKKTKIPYRSILFVLEFLDKNDTHHFYKVLIGGLGIFVIASYSNELEFKKIS